MLGSCLSSWCLRAPHCQKAAKVFDDNFRASYLKSLAKAYPQSLATALMPHFHKRWSEVKNDFHSEYPRSKHCTLPSPSCKAGSMSSIIYSTFRRTSVKLLRANTYMSTGRKSSAPYGFPEQRETQSGRNKLTTKTHSHTALTASHPACPLQTFAHIIWRVKPQVSSK